MRVCSIAPVDGRSTARLKSGAGKRWEKKREQRAEIFALPHTTDGEAFGFERGPDFGYLVALNFDGPVLYRPAGAAG